MLDEIIRKVKAADREGDNETSVDVAENKPVPQREGRDHEGDRDD